jgi:hypothetical protein
LRRACPRCAAPRLTSINDVCSYGGENSLNLN